jgi:hypothetical protein
MSTQTSSGTLYVFLHGLFGILDSDTGMDIVMPDMGPTHVYRAGKFLAETTVQPFAGAHQLTGVEGGSAHFDPAKNLLMKGIPLATHAKIYARFRFPLPVAVHSFRPIDLTDAIVDPLNHFSGPVTSMVQILTYTYQDFRTVRLGGETLDIPPLIGQDGTLYMNLHLFAEEDEVRPLVHTLDGFHALVRMFEFPCPPKLVLAKAGPAMVVEDLIPGTTLTEFQDLAPRTRWLGAIGDNIRQQALRGQQFLPEIEPQGSDPVTCSPLISRV